MRRKEEVNRVTDGESPDLCGPHVTGSGSFSGQDVCRLLCRKLRSAGLWYEIIYWILQSEACLSLFSEYFWSICTSAKYLHSAYIFIVIFFPVERLLIRGKNTFSTEDQVTISCGDEAVFYFEDDMSPLRDCFSLQRLLFWQTCWLCVQRCL